MVEKAKENLKTNNFNGQFLDVVSSSSSKTNNHSLNTASNLKSKNFRRRPMKSHVKSSINSPKYQAGSYAKEAENPQINKEIKSDSDSSVTNSSINSVVSRGVTGGRRPIISKANKTNIKSDTQINSSANLEPTESKKDIKSVKQVKPLLSKSKLTDSKLGLTQPKPAEVEEIIETIEISSKVTDKATKKVIKETKIESYKSDGSVDTKVEIEQVDEPIELESKVTRPHLGQATDIISPNSNGHTDSNSFKPKHDPFIEIDDLDAKVTEKEVESTDKLNKDLAVESKSTKATPNVSEVKPVDNVKKSVQLTETIRQKNIEHDDLLDEDDDDLFTDDELIFKPASRSIIDQDNKKLYHFLWLLNAIFAASIIAIVVYFIYFKK